MHRLLASAVAVCVVASGCSSGDKSTGPSGNTNTVTTTGGTVASTDGSTALVFPAGAVAASTNITITPRTDPTGNEFTAPGTVNEFGPDGTQFAQPVALTLKYDPTVLNLDRQNGALRIAKLVNNVWQPITEGLVRDTIAHTVTARIRSFSTYGLNADPCFIGSLGAAGASGQISKNDCLYSSIHRHSDYFSFGTTTGKQFNLIMTGNFAGLFGIKEPTADPTAGLVWAFTGLPADGSQAVVSVITPGGAYQMFVSGVDSLTFGTYTLISTQTEITPRCAGTLYITPGAAATTALNATNSCSATVARTTIPESFGQPTYTHTYTAKLDAGKIYTITANTSMPATLTAYQGGGFVAQSTNQVSGTKSITIATTGATYYTFVIESGSFTGPKIPANWSRGTGTYTLTVGAGT